MRFYSMSHRETLGLPLNTFWMLNRNISRIQSEEDLRHLRLLAVAQNGEGVNEVFTELQRDMGTPIIYVARMEKGAINRLKQLTASGSGA